MCFEEQHRSICLDTFKDSDTSLLISVFLVREDAAFLQNKKVQSYHIAQSMAYIIIFVTAYVSYFLFKHSNTFRNKDVWTMKTLKENLWDTRMLKKKKNLSFIISIMTLTCRF